MLIDRSCINSDRANLKDKTKIILIRINQLSEELKYPNCEGKADTELMLRKFESWLIQEGIIR